MLTVFSIDYITNEMMGPKTEVIALEETKMYLEEYVPVAHKYLADKLGVDTKEVKILDWEYLGRK